MSAPGRVTVQRCTYERSTGTDHVARALAGMARDMPPALRVDGFDEGRINFASSASFLTDLDASAGRVLVVTVDVSWVTAETATAMLKAMGA